MPKKQLSAIDQLPVRFVLCIVGIQYLLFIFFWSLPGLQLDTDPITRNDLVHRKGTDVVSIIIKYIRAILALVGSVFFHVVLIMFMFSFYQTSIAEPGFIPDTHEWRVSPDPLKLHERDPDGQLRFCVYEKKYKPDRSHYCRQLQRNILRMDHFCPWVANGIGFYNYKFFFLSLFYGLICLFTTSWLMGSTFIQQWQNPEISWGILYFNFLGAFLGACMTCVLLPFFIFHVWLTSKNLTTIEFCELSGKGIRSTNYDLGNLLYNFATIFGVNPHYWWWPIGGPLGDGLSFHTCPNKEKSSRIFF